MFSFRSFVLLVSMLCFGVFTQLPAQTITQRQVNQEKRIHQGVKSGELTHHEAKALQKEQRKIERDKLKAKADGVITKQEARKIKAEQKAASNDIFRKKHNNRVR